MNANRNAIRLISILLCTVMMMGLIPLSVFADGGSEDAETTEYWQEIDTTPVEPEIVDGYYALTEPAHLYWLAEYVRNGREQDSNCNAKLMNDINLNPGVTFTYQEETGYILVEKHLQGGTVEQGYLGTGMKGTISGEWNGTPMTLNFWYPIGGTYESGNSQYYHQSLFDGNGYTIDGVYFNCAEVPENISAVYGGLFGYSAGSVIWNLTLGANSCIMNGSLVGGICAFGSSRISDCVNRAIVVGDSGIARSVIGIGGIMGTACGYVWRCENYGTVIGNDCVGGIVGGSYSNTSYDSNLRDCVNYGAVYGYGNEYDEAYAGGIIAKTTFATRTSGISVLRCVNYGKITSVAYAAGVFCDATDSDMEFCANFGDVYGESAAAGLIYNTNPATNGGIYANSYNAGTVRTGSVGEAYALFGKSIYGESRVHLCFNDESVCSLPLYPSATSEDAVIECESVSHERFQSGEIGYRMSRKDYLYTTYSGMPWIQCLTSDESHADCPKEDYPRLYNAKLGNGIYDMYDPVNQMDVIYRNTTECCAGASADGHSEHLTYSYANEAVETIQAPHVRGEDGYCIHCGLDMRAPVFSAPFDLGTVYAGDYSSWTLTVDGAAEITLEFVSVTADGVDVSDGKSFCYYVYGSDTLSGYTDQYAVTDAPVTVCVTVKATNDYGSATQEYTFTVEPAQSFAILTEKLPSGKVGEKYFATIETTKPGEAYLWISDTDPLPAGLSFDSKSCAITGVPEKAFEGKIRVCWNYMKEEGDQTYALYIEKAFDPEPELKNGFYNEDDGLRYYVDGVPQTGWFEVDGRTFYGKLATGICIDHDMVIGGKQYLWDDKLGLTLANGFVYDNMGAICFENGIQVFGWRHADGTGPSVDENGISEQYSTSPNSLYYFLSTTGYMVTDSTYTISGYVREFNDDHTVKPLNGLQNRYDVLYYYVDGVMQTGWQTVDDNTYYFRASDAVYGRAATKWMYIGDKLYYFYATTSATPYALKTSGTIGGISYTYAEDGQILYTGFVNTDYANANNSNAAAYIQKMNGTTRYLVNGEVQYGWQQIGGNWYYFYAKGSSNGSGYMCTTSRTIGGVWYEFDENGVCLSK